jgi:pSer/pThr/pTyr-binding forkhead associated (FHA) protein
MEASADRVSKPDMTPRHTPLTRSIARRDGQRIEQDTKVLLQSLPSGACFWLSLETPIILGRNASFRQEDGLDLSHFAYRHHLSRRHCALQRCGARLIVTDLGSAYGTYLNGERLLPGQEYGVADGDRLVLGTLHLAVYFVDLSERERRVEGALEARGALHRPPVTGDAAQ